MFLSTGCGGRKRTEEEAGAGDEGEVAGRGGEAARPQGAVGAGKLTPANKSAAKKITASSSSSSSAGPSPEEEAAAAGADRRAAQKAGQRPPTRVRGEGRHHRGHHHRWGRRQGEPPRGPRGRLGSQQMADGCGRPQLGLVEVHPVLRGADAAAASGPQRAAAQQTLV